MCCSCFVLIMSAPPYDRAIALPCRMSVFRDRWFHSACGCGRAVNQPVRQMLSLDSGAGARSLAETVVRLRCGECGRRPAEIYLAEDGRGPRTAGGAPAGWVLLLHADPVPDG